MKSLIAIVAIVGVILSSSYVLYVLSSEVDQQTLEHQIQQQEIYANQAALSIQNFFDQFNHSLKFLTTKSEIINFTNISKEYMHDYFNAHSEELRAITRISAEGKIIYTYPFVQDIIGLDVSQQKHNAEIIKTNKPVISDVFTTVQGYRAFAYAYPIIDNNEYKGCITLVIPFEYIANKFLHNIKIGEDGTSFIISESGIELYCSEIEHIGRSIFDYEFKNEAFEKLGQMMLQKKDGVAEYLAHDEKSKELIKRIAVYKSVPIENTFWSLAVIVNEEEVLKTNRGFLFKLILLFGIISFGVLLFLYIYARQRRKSRKLINDKEIKYKGNLEKLVEKRTKELKSLNDSLKNDILKRKIIEEELKKAIEIVEKSEKIKSEFLAQMSHEIRTPVNTILSFSSLIKEELAHYADEDLKYGFSGIESASKRLIRTIDLILNMSDVQLGTHEYFPKEIDVCTDILENLIVEYRVPVHDKKLKMNLKKMDPNLKILGDSYTINQIFANLIDNAIKYTREGSISIECGRNNEDELFVSVIDSGVGISKEYIPRLFDQFTQEDKGYTRKFEGNGLGLALVKKYCELNNSEIYVESTKNVGTKITVVFSNDRPQFKNN